MSYAEKNYANAEILLIKQLGYTRYYGPYSCEEKP